jgi:hypothetical protein
VTGCLNPGARNLPPTPLPPLLYSNDPSTAQSKLVPQDENAPSNDERSSMDRRDFGAASWKFWNSGARTNMSLSKLSYGMSRLNNLRSGSETDFGRDSTFRQTLEADDT